MLDWPNILFRSGEDVFVEADVKSVAGLVSGAAVDVARKAWGALKRVGSSVLYIGRLITLKWPWMKIAGVNKEKILQIAIPVSKSAEFDEIIESGQMNKTLAEDVKQPKEGLQKILAGKSSDELDELITKHLEGIRVSVSKTEDMIGDVKAQNIFLGEAEIASNNHHELFHVGKNQTGTFAQTYVAKGGHLKSTITGGSSVMTVGLKSEDINSTNKAYENNAGDKLKVTVRFSDRKVQGLVFDFAKDKIIRDLQTAIMDQNGMDCIIKHGKTGDTLDDFEKFVELEEKYPDILDRYLIAEKRQ